MEHGVPAWACAVVLRDLADQRVGPTLPGLTCETPMVLGRVARQGAPLPPPCIIT